MRAFLAHPKGWNDGQIEASSNALKQSLEARTGQTWSVVPGRDDYNDNIYSDGNFNSWIQSVPRRIDSFTRDRLYAAIVVPTERMGKATAGIMTEASKVGMAVIHQAADHSLYQVDDLIEDDGDDYQNGWFLVKGKAL